jgi:anti-sigma factor RsiW
MTPRESNCRRICSLLTSYIDEALTGTDRADVERHLNACPSCRSRMLEEQGGRTVLRECATALRDETPPPGLRSRCEALARECCAARVPAWRRRLVPAGIVGFFLFFLVLAVLSVATNRSDALLAAQLTADHVKCFKVFVAADAPAVDAGAAERHLAEEYGWQMQVPPSSPDRSLRLVGARRCLYAHGLVPHVMYETGSQPVSLFKLAGVERAAVDVSSLGHRSRIWSRGNDTFVLVAPDAAAPDLPRIAEYMQAVAR